MSTKRDTPSPRVNTEPFTFHFKSDAKKILSAFCKVNSDKNMGVIINELVIEHILKSKNITLQKDDKNRRVAATVVGDNGSITINLSHDLE